MDLGGFCSLDDFRIFGSDVAIFDIGQDRIVEERAFLLDYAQQASERALRDLTDVLAVDFDAAFADIEETEQ